MKSLVVDSVTGVDVALPIAGPGARSFAFIIDWHIRTILSVAWYIVAAMLHNGSLYVNAPLAPDSAWFVYVIAPPAAIYFLYHPVWEVATRGHTPGKRMAGLQIVSRDGGAPGVGSLLARNVFRLVDSFPVAYAVGLVTTMVTRDHVRIGDLAAGTLLVYVHDGAPLAHYGDDRPAEKQLDATTAEVVTELLQRWETLDDAPRRRMAQRILADTTADDATLRARLESLATGGRS
ncbi:MAG: RDD family protein [Steroidobacteraceae bacterium]